jgi:hypothetical protein
MKQVISLFTFGIGVLLFLAFFNTLKPTVVSAASGPVKPGPCSTEAPTSLACRSLILVTALWPDVERQQ